MLGRKTTENACKIMMKDYKTGNYDNHTVHLYT